MKKFIYSFSLFFAPLLILILVTEINFVNPLDLARVGFISVDGTYRSKFKDEYRKEINFSNVSGINDITKYDILTIGDSFSDQENVGYQNYLADIDSNRVLHYDLVKGFANPINILYGIINNSFLDTFSVNYIILEIVERNLLLHTKDIDYDYKLSHKDQRKGSNTNEKVGKFPPIKYIKFPLFSLLYNFDDNAYFSKVYKLKTDTLLFSNNSGDLLFYYNDLLRVENNNKAFLVSKFNDEMNKLAKVLNKKGIELIFLPAPDKYDIYYNYISEKEAYPKPRFFEIIDDEPKDYLFVNTKALLTSFIPTKKDIYYYDDTHWTPIAAKIIAEHIANRIIKRHKQNNGEIYERDVLNIHAQGSN